MFLNGLFYTFAQNSSMKYFENVLDSIGNTPLIKINSICKDTKALVLAKVETTNPGNSVKDRMALKMIEDAEKAGLIKHGGTVIEGTSGNTGMGLALACIVKGYKLICVLNDKQSKEKMDILRAVGAEVVVCPTAVEPDDPRSYYSVAKRLANETPNSWYVNQYDNLSNRKAHYESTGPEIWEQTNGKITHFVVGVGTGGTISGVAKYLKEKNPEIKIWGIDTYGSVFKKYHETGVFDENEIYPYITEGIGEDILPANVDFDLIDRFEKVTDKDAAVYTRKLAREEGIFVGNSAGAAIKGVCQLESELKEEDVVVVLFHDHGSRYIGKIFNDDWMKERGFLEEDKKIASEIVASHNGKRLITADVNDPLSKVMVEMKQFDISQVPVFEDGKSVGSISDHSIFQKIMDNPKIKEFPVKQIMEKPFPEVDENYSINELSKLFNNENRAVLVNFGGDKKHIITLQDMMNAIGN